MSSLILRRLRAAAIATSAVVASLASVPLSAGTWQSAGLTGQTVFALARDPSGSLYAGAWSLLFVSIDTGQTWTQLPDLPPGSAEVFGLAVNPATHHVFIATETGLYRSTDRGLTWDFLGHSLVGIYDILARGDGLLLAIGSGGTQLSTDDGVSWELVHTIGSGTPIGGSLGLLPDGEFMELNHESLHRSSGQGHVWTDVATMRDSGAMVSSFTIDRTRDIVYRGDIRVIDPQFRIGYVLYRSLDRGGAWQRVDSGKYMSPDPLFCDSRGAVWMNRPDSVWAPRLYESLDSGDTWAFAGSGLPVNVSAISFLEYSPGLLFAGTHDSGLFRLSFAPGACCVQAGDANSDGKVSSGDAIKLVDHVFRSGPPPFCPAEGDANGDQLLTASDIIRIINYIFRGGAAPVCGAM